MSRTIRASITALVSILAFAACASEPDGAEERASPSKAARGPYAAPQGLAPFPYAPEEIRKSHPPGTYTLYRIEAGENPALLQRFDFVAADGDGCRIEQSGRFEDGTLAGEPAVVDASWDELREHASFPDAATELSEESVETPAGRFECWRYDVRREKEGSLELSTFWFDRASAGSPVRVVRERDGEEVFRMTLLETNRAAL